MIPSSALNFFPHVFIKLTASDSFIKLTPAAAHPTGLSVDLITAPCASASRLKYSMIAAIIAALPLPGNSGGAPDSSLHRSDNDSLCISLSKPIWIVRTESNVRKEKIKKSDPPCVVCSGSGRVDCGPCEGRGRTNYVNLPMLPKGEWPRWCKVCGGSGLGYCNRCLGTGEYRDILGFHFMKMDTNSSRY